METFSVLLAICAGNSPVPGEFPAQRPVTRSFDVFFDLRLNKRLSKQWSGWWFETLSCPLWRQCNTIVIYGSLRCIRMPWCMYCRDELFMWLLNCYFGIYSLQMNTQIILFWAHNSLPLQPKHYHNTIIQGQNVILIFSFSVRVD